MNRALWLIAAVAALGMSSTSFARPTPLGTAFTYQGRLTQGGSPGSGLYDLQFALYDAAAGGAQIGATFCANDVNVSDGLFTVLLNFGAQFNGQERFLEIGVRADSGLDCTDSTGFTLLGPRQLLSAAPHAMFALSAGAALNATQLNGQAASFYQNASNLNAGTIGSALLSGAYTNSLTFSNAGNAFMGSFSGGGAALTALNGSNLASGTVADARLSTNVALLNSPQTFTGSKAFSTAPAFTAVGTPFSVTSTGVVTNLNADLLDGLHASAFLQSIPVPLTLSGLSNAYIIKGENTSPIDGTSGVRGVCTAGSGISYGVHAENSSTEGRGVLAMATAATGATYGVYGQSDSTSGHGIYGLATAASGFTYGGQFGSFSTQGRGIFALETATTGTTFGGYFQNDSTSGRGVYAQATANTGTNYGVLGSASTAAAGYAVFASGDMGASGVKPFRIDHPDDPTNKYLLHYAAESPEVINFYSGKVVVNGAGEAIVEMPHYFAKINKDPRYTLTAIGAAMPNLHIAEEISDDAIASGGPCWFRIAGGAPGMKVSWEVKALRNDLWVQKRGAPVEIEKQGPEKGTYQHPELYGQPPEKGMNYDAARADRLAR